MKYIIFKDQVSQKEHGVIFPDGLIHKDAARIHRVGFNTIQSAGFVQKTDEGTLHAFGSSESLQNRFPARSEDSTILTKQFSDLL